MDSLPNRDLRPKYRMVQEETKVKMVYKANPKKVMYVTKAAAALLSTKWEEAADQASDPGTGYQKKAAAAPVAVTSDDDKKAELRETFNELTGTQADPQWNAARLFVEIRKAQAKTKAPVEVEVETTDEPVTTQVEAEAAPKAKRTRKAKPATAEA